MLMSHETRERLTKEAQLASTKIKELLPKIQEKYPLAEFTPIESSGFQSGKIIVPFDINGSRFNATIFRMDSSRSSWNRNFTLRVGVNAFFSSESYKQFTKSFSGSRLKTDILSDKFDVTKIINALEQIDNWVKTEAERKEFEQARLNEKQSELDDLMKYLSDNTSQEYSCGIRDVHSKDDSISATLRHNELYNLTLAKVTKEEMVSVINHLSELRQKKA